MRILLLLCVSGCSLFAQDATVTGIVTDSAAAVVPGVQIRIRNVDTGIARTVVTNHEGSYTITTLPPGPYELTAELTGFRGYQKTGIVLEIGMALRDDIQLAVGGVTESVHVTAEIAALNTENGAIKGDVIVQQEIMDLPLDGRDFTDLAFLVPGVMPAAQGGQGSGMNVNGARATDTNFYVDGFSNRNPRGAAAQARPNMSAMQEFKMEVSGYSAEMGRMAGGVMNMVMKSGANQYHGDVFYYIRNNVIDARSFFDVQKQKLNRRQYGATLHGPVQLPKLYDGHNRTFFMFSWESYKQLIGGARLTHVPSALERLGDYSRSFSLTGAPVRVTDPLGGNQPFPGNIMPASRFDAIAQKLLAYYPAANRANPRLNLLTSGNDNDTWDSFIVKADHRFSEKNSMSYRYQIRFNNTMEPFPEATPLGIFGNLQNDDRSLMGIDFTHMFTPTFLVEMRSGFSRNTTRNKCVWNGIDVAGQLGIPDSTKDPDLVGFPLFNVTDYSSLGCTANMPVEYHVTDIQGSFKFTWVKSRHVMKWGYEHSRVRINQPYFNNNRGTFVFNGARSSFPMADFMMGMMNQTTRQVGWNRNYLRSTSVGMYFVDDFKLRPNLTLNLGVRYEIDMIPHDRYNHITNFVPEIGKLVLAFNDPTVKDIVARAGLAERVTYAEAVGLPANLVYPDYTNIAPRVGFAWTPWKDRRTVLRGGYGMFYTGLLLNPYRNQLQNTFPYAQTETFTWQAARQDYVTLSNPFPNDRAVTGGTTTSSGVETHAPTGYMHSANLTVERDLGNGTALEIGIVGSRGIHLSRLRDINLPRRTEAAYMANIAVVNLRPFPFFNGAINQFQFVSNSIYYATQFSIRKRARGGTFFRLNYSYGKSLDDASQVNGTSDAGILAASQDINNRRADYSRSDSDRGHVMTAAFSWQVPFGRGRKFFRGAHGLGQGLIGGWQFSGATFMATGAPLTPVAADVNLNLGESQKPNRIAKGIPDEIPGQKRGVDRPWFDPAAFVKVPQCVSVAVGCPADKYGFKPFVYGNSGRNILDGPGLAYVNLSMMKNFRFEERKNIQFRFESFNAFNHPNFLMPINSFNGSGAGLIVGVAQGGRGGARVFQASLKFDF
ncbi:MAG TPA: carboxypeptidase regulatory-like domain-containing protein [Bryobacteraceae bacterium]|nr:carboxypeptidase regulatory-like domain-containing protein [Bryobacteraceae bacterium]